jgi:hypothetical protein
MKKFIIALALAMFAMNAQANQWSGNVNFLLGAKSLDSTDWDPVDDHAAFGVMVDFKQQDWPISIALDFLGSYGEETVGIVKFEGSTSEFNAGVRKIWEVSGSSIRPFLGGGIAFVYGEFKGTNVVSVSLDDNGTGIWLDGGIYWTLGQSFNLGFDLRYSSADITLAGIEGDAGGTYAGLLLGYHW